MPTVLREGPYRFFFYSADGGEPPHVHVERDERVAKIWLEPVRLSRSGRFSRAEISDIIRVVTSRRGMLLEAWNGYFHG
jgi:hypothetical protein